MFTTQRLCACAFLVLCLLSTGRAQGENPAQPASQTSTSVTASATAERVRFTAPSNVVRMQLAVVSETGQVLFEVSSKGNVFDWTLQDSNGQRVQGSYLTVVTVKSLSGKMSQRIGTVSVAQQEVELKPLEAAGLTAAQQQAVGPVEENSALTILKAGETPATTVLANDGKDGHMIRGRGALTFRIGDFFSGLDTEQMRLTEDGRLGIGTSEPQAKLDVAGTIRAQRVLIARPEKPGNDSKTQAGISATDTLATDSGEFQTLIAGTGTPDRIAKWIDKGDTLGDSGITETAAGFVGIGTTVPGSKLVVSANTATLPPASGIARFADADGVQTAIFADAFGTNPIFNVRRANGTAAAPSAVQINQLLGVIGASGYGTSAYSGTRARVAFWASENWKNSANGTFLTFNTTDNGAVTPGGTERLRIDNAGRIGIGTTAPVAALQVRNTPIDSGNATFFNGAGAMFATANNNGGSNPTGSETALVLAREGISGQAFANFARFNLNRFEIAGTAPRTQLDIGLAHDDLFGEANNTPTILTLRSNGNVGIRNTNPKAALDVNGDIKARNLPGIEFSQGFRLPTGGDEADIFVEGESKGVDELNIFVPTSGFLFITAYATLLMQPAGDSFSRFFFELQDLTGTPHKLTDSRMSGSGGNLEGTLHLSWVLEITDATPHNVHLKTLGSLSDEFTAGEGRAIRYGHNLTAIFIPNRY